MTGGVFAPNPLPPELMEKLWTDPNARSRNANFARFRDDDTYRRAVRHIRSMLAFRSDLKKFKGQSVVSLRWLASGKGAVVTMSVPELHLRRSLYVTAHELDLLRRDPSWNEADVVLTEEKPIYLSR